MGLESVEECAADLGQGRICRAPAMLNGRCRLHGGKAVGSSHRAKHGLYRKRFSAEEQETFDALMLDTNFEDMRAEVALLRMIIDRCVKAIVEGDEWRVPMQALPQYMEKLLKVVERMKPSGSTHLIKEDDLDRELKQIFKQEAALRDAARGTEE